MVALPAIHGRPPFPKSSASNALRRLRRGPCLFGDGPARRMGSRLTLAPLIAASWLALGCASKLATAPSPPPLPPMDSAPHPAPSPPPPPMRSEPPPAPPPTAPPPPAPPQEAGPPQAPSPPPPPPALPPPPTEPSGPPRPPAPSHGSESTALPAPPRRENVDWQQIFFATNRAPVMPATNPERLFGSSRSDSLHFGHCSVSFPHDHRMGKIERPHWWKFEFKANPREHV